jgi:hypothetical protein
LQWRSWILIIIACVLLSGIGFTFLRYNSKLIRLKYLFAYHRLHEQIGLEINSINTMYSHLPTSDTNNSNRTLDNVLFDDNELSALEMTDTQINKQIDEFQDDPFYIDEKQPIFSDDRNLNTRIL